MKNILVTGASSGIGEAVCRFLSEGDYKVIMVARNNEKMRKIADELKTEPLMISYDLQNLEDIESIFHTISDKGIKLDGLVHAAGINRDIPIKSNDIELMKQVTTIHYYSFVELGKYFAKKKYTNDNGSIVAISSLASFRCDKGMCTYSAAKAALEAAVSVMSKELRNRGHRANAILPSFVDTPMIHDENNPIIDIDNKIANQPMGLVKPLDVAYLVEYLLSEKARFISDAHIPIGGGYSL